MPYCCECIGIFDEPRLDGFSFYTCENVAGGSCTQHRSSEASWPDATAHFTADKKAFGARRVGTGNRILAERVRSRASPDSEERWSSGGCTDENLSHLAWRRWLPRGTYGLLVFTGCLHASDPNKRWRMDGWMV